MTKKLIEFAEKLEAHAALEKNYNAGWDIIVEATTREELLAMISGDTDEEYASMLSIFPDYPRMEPAPTYKEAKRRVKRIVDMHEEQRRAIQNTVW